MFSGTKFRLWSRQSSSKKDAEKESSKNKSKNVPLPSKGEDEGGRQSSTRQDKAHLQKLQEDYARLEDAVEELTPFKSKAFALEKKLIYITKSFERKQNRYSSAIASLEAENEQLQEEMRRMKSICGSCYFCSRHQMTAHHPEAAKLLQSSRRADQSSNESLGSSRSSRRLQKLEEEQSAIVQETSRQKQETSRCLEQISSEVMKALVSQKVLRRDCTQLQCRILQLEKQNSQLNEVIFRQYPPYHSQTNFLTDQRNEKVLSYHPQLQLHSPWDEVSLPSTSAMETIKYEEKTTSQKLFRYSPNQRFGVEICRPTSDCVSYNYIPEQVMVNSNSAANISTNHDRQTVPFHKDVSLVDNVTNNAKHSLGADLFLDIRNEDKSARSWDLSTGSTLTLRDETINGENDSQCKNSFNRGSTFSLNDILDGDIDELQLNIQSHEGTKNNDSAGNTNNINRPWYGIETGQHLNDCRQQNSKPLMFMGETKDTSALQIASDSCPMSSEKIFKEQEEPPQVPFSGASKNVQSGISFDNFGVAKQKTAAEKRHRYSYPAALPVKSALKSELHTMYCTQTENSTELQMAEASEALQTVTKAKQAVQKFQLWNFETFFDESDTDMLGTIKERTVPVTESQPQLSKHEVRLSGAAAEKAEAEKAVKKDAKMSTSVQEDASQRSASDENPEKWNLTQESILEGNTKEKKRKRKKETPPNMDTYTSGGNPLMASPPHNNALWVNNVGMTRTETNPSEDSLSDPSHAMCMIKQQDTANKEDSRPSYCDHHPEQAIGSEERKHEQNDIPAESVDKKAEMESIIQKKRERFDSISNDNISKDSAKDVTMSKDKVMALTAYFEEVHVEQCPDCQQSGTRCKIASAYRLTLGSKDNSLSEDDSRLDGNAVIDLDWNQIKKSQDDADETLKTGEKHDLLTNETLTSPMSVSETSKCEAAVSDTSACDTSVQGAPHVTSDDFNVSENVLFSDTGLKVSTNSRGNSSEATNSQTEGTRLKDEMVEINKTEPEQFKHNLISSVGESNSVTKKIENTEDHEDRDLKMRLLGGQNLTKTSDEQLVSKPTQWKSLPSVSASDTHPPFQVKYIRTLSLKSFSDALTPPPSPKLHKENEKTKRLDQAHGFTRECGEDMFNIYEATQDPQHETQNQQSDQTQWSSQSNTKTLSEKQAPESTEAESQGCLQSYAQVQLQTQAKQFTVFSENKSEAQNFPHWSHLHSQIHSTNQGQFEVYSRDESRFCAQNYPQDHMIDDLLYPRHHSPKMNPFVAEEAFKTQLQQVKGCPMLSSAEIELDDRQDDLTCSPSYPDLLSSSHPKVTMRRSQRSHEIEGKCNVLTEEDIMKYRLDCHDSRRTTMDSYPQDLQSDIVSLEAMGSPGNSHGLRILSSKPPLPPRRFHVTKYYVRDGSNQLLDPKDFFNFEDEVLGFIPDVPHADVNPTRNEFVAETNQRTTIWDRERQYTSHSRGIDFNYPGTDAMRQGGETNSLGLESATVRHSRLIENSKTGVGVSPPQGYQPAVSWQSGAKRNSYPDCSGKDYSQPPAWWDDKDIAAGTTWHPLQRDQIRRPVSFHQATESANYQHSFNRPLNAAAAHRRLPTHSQQLESNQKNSKDTENDFVFNEISKQIENLRQTVSELQKKSTENK